MESYIHIMTSVLLLYFSQEEVIPNDLIILHKQAFQSSMEKRFAGITLNLFFNNIFDNEHALNLKRDMFAGHYQLSIIAVRHLQHVRRIIPK